jgi:hypothetical protein
MLANKTIDKALDKWAKKELAKLPRKIRRLINQADFDLWYGPCQDKSWPGFITATKLIHAAIENIHCSDVWIDLQCEEIMTSEPQGFWDENPDHDPNDADSEKQVWVEPCWDDVYHVETFEVKRAMFGKELAHYL